MPEKKKGGNELTVEILQQNQLEKLRGSQDGLLGIPMLSIPGTTSFMFAGWYFQGVPLLLCNTNQIITLPDVFEAEATDLVCTSDDDQEQPVSKYTVDLDMRVQLQSLQLVSLKQLHPEYRAKEAGEVSPLDIFDDIRKELEKIGAFIERVIRECRGDPRCVYNKVWDHLVRQICGSDCFRYCSFDCDPWDLTCHGRKLDCERLKAQCKVCEGAMGVAKEFVRAWLCTNYGVCVP